MPTDPSIAASYDRLPYVTDAIHQTHPSRLAALARIHGLRPALSTSCRVLELGCGDGGNLLPLAEILPESTFVGLDASAEAVRRGRSAIEELGLSNVRMLEGDLREAGDDFGRFDYVIAHGVYSWVPPDVQDALLRAIGARLADEGVAYVSYNLLPGRFVDRISRDLMRFHVEGLDDPEARSAQALAFLQLVANASTEWSPYSDILQEEAERLAPYPAWFLLHDHLGEHTSATYFRDFVQHAADHGLRFLTEADFETTTAFGVREEAAAQLKPLRQRFLLYQQYLDFVRGGRFRRTLLCREGAAVDRTHPADHLDGLIVAAPVMVEGDDAAQSADNDDGRDPRPVRFVGLRDQKIRTDSRLAIAVLEALGRAWPVGVPFGELVEIGRNAAGAMNPGDRVAPGESTAAGSGSAANETTKPESEPAAATDPESVRETVADLVISLLGNAFLELRDHDPPLSTEPGERPRTTRVARRQAAHSTLVTSLLHRSVPIEEVDARQVLGKLDGRRTCAELFDGLRPAVGPKIDETRLDAILRRFAREGLLLK